MENDIPITVDLKVNTYNKLNSLKKTFGTNRTELIRLSIDVLQIMAEAHNDKAEVYIEGKNRHRLLIPGLD